MDVLALPLHAAPFRPRQRGDAKDPAPPRPGRGQSPGGTPPGSVPERRVRISAQAMLLGFTWVVIALGLAALAWTTMTFPILPAIDPGPGLSSLSNPEGGLLLWVAFGFFGSLRALPMPGTSSVWTFHLPFIASAMVLGGPTAGAWVGFLATLERRELASQPWYGILANHAVMALGAVVGGLAVLRIDDLLVGTGVGASAARLIAIAAGTILLAATINGVASITILLRERLSAADLFQLLFRSMGRITVAEIALAWVFVVGYAAVGWWAPIVLSVVVLLLWPTDGFEGVDPLMKLPRMRQFQRDLDAVIARTRRGLAQGGSIMVIDLNGFGQLNKDHGMRAGDEVLAEIGDRLRGLVRVTDLIGRLGGDELAIFYAGVVDRATARALARRVEDAICRPILTSAGQVSVGVSIGITILRPAPAIPDRAALMHWADMAMQQQKKLQKEGLASSGIRFARYGSEPAPVTPVAAPRMRFRVALSAIVLVGTVVVAFMLAGARVLIR